MRQPRWAMMLCCRVTAPLILEYVPVMAPPGAMVNKPPVVNVPELKFKVPLRATALPLNVPDAAIVIVPVPLMPLPLLVILPFTVTVIPVVFNAYVLLIVNALQAKPAGAVLLAIMASVVDVGVPLLQLLPSHVVADCSKVQPAGTIKSVVVVLVPNNQLLLSIKAVLRLATLLYVPLHSNLP